MAQPTNKDDLSPFAFTLLQALEAFREPERLGAESPLAAPGLLGAYLKPRARINGVKSRAPAAYQRGLALRSLLREVVEELDGKYGERYQGIIKEYYFAGKPVAQVCDELALGKTIFHRNRKQAIEALAQLLIAWVKPAIRLESPPRLRHPLVGRDDLLTTALQALHAHQTVTITGSSGMGKTTLGSQIATRWEQGPVFWFTVRLGINDSLVGLLFAGAHFLHQHGEATLWHELITNPAGVQPHQALETLTYGLHALKNRGVTPLFCFDELDLLSPTTQGAHGQVIQLLEGLRTSVPLLQIGQQALLEPLPYVTLDALSPEETAQFLAHEQIVLPATELRQLYAYTSGIPRLLVLFLLLYTPTHTMQTIFGAMGSAPPLEYMLSRVYQRLTLEQCQLLSFCSILRSPIARQSLRTLPHEQCIDDLVQWRLIEQDHQGHLSLLPAYRTIIYDCLPAEQRLALHIQAGQLREAQGLITAAAHHWVLADQPEYAIWLWRRHQQQEINQGQAAAALELFRVAREMPLSRQAREAITLLISQLERLTGNLSSALQDIHSILYQTPILELEASLLGGMIANDLSAFEESNRLHQQVIALAESLVETKLAFAHKGLAFLYKQEDRLDAAWREALLAGYEAENIQGSIELERSNYPEAAAHYRAAYSMATELEFIDGMARTASNLANLAALTGDYEQALELQQESDDHYRQIGKWTALCSAKINWAYTYSLAGQYRQAIAALKEGLSLFEQYGIEIPARQSALFNQSLAEAYLELRELDKAEQHVRQAIESEEPTILCSAYRTFGELLLAQGHPSHAEDYMNQAITLCEERGDHFLAGYAWRAMSLVQSALGASDRAVAAKATASVLFAQLNLPQEVAKTETDVS